VAGEVNDFRFVAPTTGQITVRQQAAAGSLLDSDVTVFDGSGASIAQNDDSNGSVNSQVTFHVEAGQTYYVEAAASPLAFSKAATGRYDLDFDMGSSDSGFKQSAGLPRISLDSTGTGDAKVSLVAGQTATFTFTSPVSRVMTLDETLLAGDAAGAAAVSLYDASGNLIASDVPDGTSGVVRFKTDAGQQYFVRVAGDAAGDGNYRLSFGQDFGTDLGNARALPAASGSQVGAIATAGSGNFFDLVAPATGQLQIDVTTASGESLNNMLQVFDAQHQLIATLNGADGGVLNVAVTAGETYFLEDSADGLGTGKYQLGLEFTGLPGPEVLGPASGVFLGGPQNTEIASETGPGETGPALALLLPETVNGLGVTGAGELAASPRGDLVPLNANASAILVVALLDAGNDGGGGGTSDHENPEVDTTSPGLVPPGEADLLRFYLGLPGTTTGTDAGASGQKPAGTDGPADAGAGGTLDQVMDDLLDRWQTLVLPQTTTSQGTPRAAEPAGHDLPASPAAAPADAPAPQAVLAAPVVRPAGKGPAPAAAAPAADPGVQPNRQAPSATREGRADPGVPPVVEAPTEKTGRALPFALFAFSLGVAGTVVRPEEDEAKRDDG
jgi:hypothetical protein